VRITNADGHRPSNPILYACITLIMAIWSLNYLATKYALRYLPPLTLASFRVVAAAAFMLLVYPIAARLPAFATDLVAHKQKRTLRDLFTFAYLGFFCVALNQMCFTVGLRYTSVAHSSIILGMGPLYALILAALFRLETLTWGKTLGMLVSFIGIAILASASGGVGRHSPTLFGDLITLCGSVAFALYVVLGKRVAGKYDALTMTTWNYLFGALMALPFAIHQAIAFGPLANFRAVPWQVWACFAFTACFSSTLAYLFYFWLLRYLQASQLSAFTYFLPVAATVLGILFLGERASWLELLGAALALLGLSLTESARSS
jgi:drug/metabolite transporter (DMT)-like permease